MSRMRIDDVEIRDADIFERLLDNFPDMIHSVDDHGNVVYTNRTAESLLGYTQEELLSMNIRQIYADEVLQAVEEGFTNLKERGDTTIPESLLKTKDGTHIPVEIRSFSIYDDQGNFLRTFSIMRDLREIKELQQGLIHTSRLAAIGELSAGVAHDINNPLTVIMLSNEMILKALERANESADPVNDRVQAFAKDIQKASQSIRKLADHLRNFSRGMVEKYESIDLYDSIADSLFITQNKIQSACAQVDNDIEKGVHFISGCQNNLEQVFVNLISNACDAMADLDTRKLTISIVPCQRDGTDFWKCDIADTGTGIPNDIIDEIFQSFFTTKEKGKGTGLGLSISRAIIKEHKGDVEVHSEINKGTTFSVCLPQTAPPRSD